MATLIDSSVLVASRNEGDSLHSRAIKAMSLADKPLVVHEYVLLETATALQMRASKLIANIFVKAMFENSAFKILFSNESDFIKTTSIFLGNRTKLSFVDAALLALSDKYSVLTFDEALARTIKKKEV